MAAGRGMASGSTRPRVLLVSTNRERAPQPVVPNGVACVASALEYNVFPYSESTRRELTFLYTIGASRIRYRHVPTWPSERRTIARK